ncbi:MAG: LPS-assembly protein LptD, partial [Bdellovibrionota bacterium]
MTRSLHYLFGSLLLFLFSAGALGASSFELESLREKHHVTADRTLYHSNEKVYEAFGHVVVSSHGQRLSADYLWVDDNTKDMKARGNVIFVDRTTTVQAAEIHFNLETGIGSIFYGKVFNDLYTLKGQLIRRVSEDRFLTTEGEYTTCKDCAESWKLSARSVDLTMEGYAFLDSVFVKIKDVPTLYIPYAVLPVKTKRQTGLLFPRMGASSNNGFVFVQPLFVALSPHQDLTVAAGRYSARGMRYEAEYRYKSFNLSGGQINFYHTGDRRTSSPRQSRVGIKTENEWNFSNHFNMKLRGTEVLDRDYIYDFPEDINAQGYPSLESNIVANAPFNDFFASVEARRYRNMLTPNKVGFDTGTVQDLPAA